VTHVASRDALDPASTCADRPVEEFLIAGESLAAGDRLDCSTRQFSAVMRGDGNLVVHRTADGCCVWSSSTEGHPGASLAMLDNGDLVICTTDSARLWSSCTGGNPGSYLQLHDDGRLVVHDFYRAPLWASAEAR
jgi:hypothetical protein